MITAVGCNERKVNSHLLNPIMMILHQPSQVRAQTRAGVRMVMDRNIKRLCKLTCFIQTS